MTFICSFYVLQFNLIENDTDVGDTVDVLTRKSPGPQLLHIRTCLKGRINLENIIIKSNIGKDLKMTYNVFDNY